MDIVTGLVAAIIGGVLTGGFALWGVMLAHRKGLERQEKGRQENLKAFYGAIYAETQTLWEVYQSNAGGQLENLAEGKPLLLYYPLTQDYFTVFKANSNLIGQILDADLRKLIVTTYTKAQGLIDSYRFNNHLVDQYENCYRLYNVTLDHTLKLVYHNELQEKHDGLIEYAKILTKLHNDLKKNVNDLLERLQKVNRGAGTARQQSLKWCGDREIWIMNWKRGFKRITLLLSLLAFTAYVFFTIELIFEGDPPILVWILLGLASFIGVWVVYGIIRWGIIPIVLWVAKGFRDKKPKDEQKE